MSIHLNEIILILIVALLVIKPERLPEVIRVIAKIVKQFSFFKKQLTENFSLGKHYFQISPDPKKGQDQEHR